jgi:hypothetical protein
MFEYKAVFINHNQSAQDNNAVTKTVRFSVDLHRKASAKGRSLAFDAGMRLVSVQSN